MRHDIRYRTLARMMLGRIALGEGILHSAHCLAAIDDGGPRQGGWMFRAMALQVNVKNMRSTLSGIGGEITTPNQRTPGLDVTYFVTDRWALEVQGGVFARDYRIEKSRIGDFAVGTVESGSVSMTVQYHFRPYARLSPYLGYGFNYAWEHKIRPAPNIPNFHVKPIVSRILNMGLDYQATKHWFVSASVRYITSPTYAFRGHGFNASVDLDTLIIGVGVGYGM